MTSSNAFKDFLRVEKDGVNMTESQFKILIKEIQGLRNDLNMLFESNRNTMRTTTNESSTTQSNFINNPQPRQPVYNQQTVKNNQGFTLSNNPNDIMSRAGDILS